MLWTAFHSAPAVGEPRRACRQQTGRFYGPVEITLRIIRDGLCEGLAAQRRYRQLTSRGLAHDPALRAALGCDTATPAARSARGPCTRVRSHAHD